MDKSYKEYLEKAIFAAKKGGDLIRTSIFNRNKTIEAKTSEVDVVTETDKAVEKLIRQELTDAFPDSDFIGEESEGSGEITISNNPTWIVDPIDGTLNFVHCNYNIAVSIGLAINKKLVLGVIYSPVSDELYSAVVGGGAFKNGSPIRVSNAHELKKSMVIFEIWARSGPEHEGHQFKNIQALSKSVRALRSYGSACMDLCFTAEGQTDAYIQSGLRVWDMAAGAVIVREAGGIVVDDNGGEFDAMARNIIVASSPKLIQDIIELNLEKPCMKRDNPEKVTLLKKC